MKALYAVAVSAAVLTSWSAVAETTVSTTSRSCKSSAYGAAVCTEVTTNSTPGSGGGEAARKNIDPVEERLSREQREARIRKWEEFCKPVSFTDEMGITRLRYAHTGCDLGRTGEGPLAQAH